MNDRASEQVRASVNKRQVLENFYQARKVVDELNRAVDLLDQHMMEAAAKHMRVALEREAAYLDELVDRMDLTVRERRDDA